jgi:hypothetical protein
MDALPALSSTEYEALLKEIVPGATAAVPTTVRDRASNDTRAVSAERRESRGGIDQLLSERRGNVGLWR